MTPIEKAFQDYEKSGGRMSIAILKVKVLDEIEKIKRDQYYCPNCECCNDGLCGECDTCEKMQGQEPNLDAPDAAERREMQAKIQRDLK